MDLTATTPISTDVISNMPTIQGEKEKENENGSGLRFGISSLKQGERGGGGEGGCFG